MTNLVDIFKRIELSDEIRQSYEKNGLKEFYSWQTECLFNTEVLNRKNLVYCAPTSGGKTLVAELVMLRTVLKTRKISIFVLPFVSLVSEKERHLKKLVISHNRNHVKTDRIKIKGFYGETNPKKFGAKENLLICTIEKANIIINSLIDRGLSEHIGCIVIDEMHVLGDPQRGFLLEILISKIRFLETQSLKQLSKNPLTSSSNSAVNLSLMMSPLKIQLVALSATMGNIQELSEWFHAALYKTTFRPVPLSEMIKVGNEIINTQGEILHKLPVTDPKYDPDHILTLSLDGLLKGQQIIIFVSSRIACQTTCRVITTYLPPKAKTLGILPLSHRGNVLTADLLVQKRQDVVTSMLEDSETAETVLREGILQGIAYHHAGLSDYERLQVEKGFREGFISILVATTTLAAGVNLPAGRVLIRSMAVGNQTLGVIQYRQMCGRAGRAGQTRFGESYLLVKAGERGSALALASSPYPCVTSQMDPAADGGRGLLKAILELLVLGLCSTGADIEDYMTHTLLYHEQSTTGTTPTATAIPPGSGSGSQLHASNRVLLAGRTTLSFLINARAVDRQLPTYIPGSGGATGGSSGNGNSINPASSSRSATAAANTTSEAGSDPLDSLRNAPIRISRFGRAVTESGMNPDEAISIYEDLLRAQDCINLEIELHLAYLTTPLQHSLRPDFNKMFAFLELANKHKTPFARVFDAVGVDEGTLFRWSRRPPPPEAISTCSDKLRLLRIRMNTNSVAVEGGQPVAPAKSENENHRKQLGSGSHGLDEKEWTLLSRCRRIWAASAIVAVLDGTPLAVVANNFGVASSDIQTLIRSARMMAQRVQRFCGEIGWPPLEKLIENFKSRLEVDVPVEYKDLMRMEGLTVKVAKVLYDSGIQSLDSLVATSPEKIMHSLQLSVAFKVQDMELLERKQELSEIVPAEERNGDEADSDSMEVDCTSAVATESSSVSSNKSSKSGCGIVSNARGSVTTTAGAVTGTVSGNSDTSEASLRLWHYATGLIHAAKTFLSKNECALADAVSELVAAIGGEASGGDREGHGGSDSDSDNEEDVDEEEEEEDDEEEEEEEDEGGMTGFVHESVPWLRRIDIHGTRIENDKVSTSNDNKKRSYSTHSVSPLSDVSKKSNIEDRREQVTIIGTGTTGAVPYSEKLREGKDKSDCRKEELMTIQPTTVTSDKIVSNHLSNAETGRLVLGNNDNTPPVMYSNSMTAVAKNREVPLLGDKENIPPPSQLPSAHIDSDSDDMDAQLLALLEAVESGLLQPAVFGSDEKTNTSSSCSNTSSSSSKTNNITESNRLKKPLVIEEAKAAAGEVVAEEILEDYNQEEDRHLAQDLVTASATNPHEHEGEPSSAGGDESLLHRSPYLTPFTPSKTATPGRYLYLPQSCSATSSSASSEYLGAAEVCLDCKGFGWKHLSEENHCIEFLAELKVAKCFSFDLLLRNIPIATTTTNKDEIKRQWSRYISYQSSASGMEVDTNGSLSGCSSPVLSGISICFGKEFGYYLPLPTPLPSRTTHSQPTSKTNASAPTARSVSVIGESVGGLSTITGSAIGSGGNNYFGHAIEPSLTSLPNNALLLINRYIGFESILHKCPQLRRMLLKRVNTPTARSDRRTTGAGAAGSTSLSMHTGTTGENTLCPSNPLLTVSKAMMSSARDALLIEWRKGSAVEWRLISEMFHNPNIGKISLLMKQKVVVLRERDILVSGALEDPSIASALLQGIPSVPSVSSLLGIPHCCSQSPSTTLNGCSRNDVDMHHQHHHRNNVQKLCYQTIAVFRAAAVFTPILRSYSLLNLYRNIEMPLLLTVASAEYCGMPMDSRFLTKLRQDLFDRQKTIEYYFEVSQGKDFSLTSPVQGKSLRMKLQDELSKSGVVSSSGSTYGEDFIKHHPLLQLLSEWRSHARCIQLCFSILKSKFRPFGTGVDRVHACFNTLGAETGRLIITSPPLQQVPHECKYWITGRPTLQEELETHLLKYGNLTNLQQYITQRRTTGNSEWVRVTSIRSLQCSKDASVEASFSQPTSQNQNQCLHPKSQSEGATPPLALSPPSQLVESCGKLYEISNTTIDQPFLLEDSSAMCCRDSKHAVERVANQWSKLSLAELWRHAGFIYDAADSKRIKQVRVDMSGGHLYTYPADQVTRLLAPLRPPLEEMDALKQTLSGGVARWAANYRTDATATASSSSTNPSFCTVNPRDGFRATRGYVLLSADYSQIELRLMAHLCRDPTLLAAFHSGVDVFRSLAAGWRNKREDDVTDGERDVIKQLCYAILYGAGPNRIAMDSGYTLQQATAMYSEFLSLHRGIPSFIKSVHVTCKANGFVETILARRRYLPDIRSSDGKRRSAAERQAVNTICQGSAADLIKLAMINIHHQLHHQDTEDKNNNNNNYCTRLNSNRVRSCPGGGLYSSLDVGDVRLILMVHDELLFEVPEEKLYKVADIVRECMENAVHLSVPLQVKLKVGLSWGNMKPLLDPVVRSIFGKDDD